MGFYQSAWRLAGVVVCWLSFTQGHFVQLYFRLCSGATFTGLFNIHRLYTEHTAEDRVNIKSVCNIIYRYVTLIKSVMQNAKLNDILLPLSLRLCFHLFVSQQDYVETTGSISMKLGLFMFVSQKNYVETTGSISMKLGDRMLKLIKEQFEISFSFLSEEFVDLDENYQPWVGNWYLWVCAILFQIKIQI